MSLPVDLGFELGGQSVDHRSTNAVEPPRRGICAAAELATSVELGQHDLKGRNLALWVFVDGNASAVVGHFDRSVTVKGDEDAVGFTRGCFIDGVVDQLPHQVLETS